MLSVSVCPSVYHKPVLQRKRLDGSKFRSIIHVLDRRQRALDDQERDQVGSRSCPSRRGFRIEERSRSCPLWLLARRIGDAFSHRGMRSGQTLRVRLNAVFVSRNAIGHVRHGFYNDVLATLFTYLGLLHQVVRVVDRRQHASDAQERDQVGGVRSQCCPSVCVCVCGLETLNRCRDIFDLILCYKYLHDQWCIAKNGGGYTQRGVAKGLKVPYLFTLSKLITNFIRIYQSSTL